MNDLKTDLVEFLNWIGQIAENNEVLNDFSFLEINGEGQNEFSRIQKEANTHSDVYTSFLSIIDNYDDSWKLNFNKDLLKQYNCQFFTSEKHFYDWLLKQPVFDNTSFFNSNNDLKHILIYELQDVYLGPRLNIIPCNIDALSHAETSEIDLPEDEEIKSNAHIVSDNLVIYPQNLLLSKFGESEWGYEILSRFVLLLAVCLAQEIQEERVTIKGVRRVDYKIDSTSLLISDLGHLKQKLLDTVSWVYEENTQTRLKLISNRISLDIVPDSLYLEGLSRHLSYAITEAKEKYEFIITEKSDEFNQEQRALQDQIFSRTKLYSDKLRNLLAGIMRDSLAGIFLIAFGLLSKTDPSKISLIFAEGSTILILFKVLGVYFLISWLLQLTLNITDIRLMRKELLIFAKTTRNYLREDQIHEIINSSLNDRDRVFWTIYVIVSIMYISISYVAWNFQCWADFIGLL